MPRLNLSCCESNLRPDCAPLWNENLLDLYAIFRRFSNQLLHAISVVWSQIFTLFLSSFHFVISRFKKLSAGHIKYEHWFQRQPLSEIRNLVRGVFYVRYAVSYRDLEKILAERGVQADHATLNRWVVKYSPDSARAAQIRKHSTAASWRMDETYIMVKGKWIHSYRAIDKHGKTLDFILSKGRDWAAARLFFRRAIETNGLPSRILIDKSGTNLAGLERINVGLMFSRTKQRIEILRVKYLNNIVEQDYRFIKKSSSQLLASKPSIQPQQRSRESKWPTGSERNNSRQTIYPHSNSSQIWQPKFGKNAGLIRP